MLYTPPDNHYYFEGHCYIPL